MIGRSGVLTGLRALPVSEGGCWRVSVSVSFRGFRVKRLLRPPRAELSRRRAARLWRIGMPKRFQLET